MTAPSSGPCAWPIDTSCVSNWDSYTDAQRAMATAFATEILWAATGRQFGTCQVTVRPCLNERFNGLGVYWADGTYMPFVWNGEWYNAWLGCGCYGFCHCGARPFTQAWLPGPIAQVLEVKIDGAILSDSAYRVDNAMWLIRTDGGTFPVYQNVNAPDGADHTWDVTYLRGQPVPLPLQGAAGILAGQYLLACAGEQCRFPGYVTSVLRTGVQMETVPFNQLLVNGMIGIQEVDMLIKAYNPAGLTHRPRIWSPDIERDRITTQPEGVL